MSTTDLHTTDLHTTDLHTTDLHTGAVHTSRGHGARRGGRRSTGGRDRARRRPQMESVKSNRICESCSCSPGTGIGYSPVKQAVHSFSRWCGVEAINPWSER